MRSSMHKHITFRNQKISPFLRLPAELRNLIYQHTIGCRILTVTSYHDLTGCGARFSIHDTTDHSCSNPRPPVPEPRNTKPNILATVCRQIQHETKFLPDQYNAFRGLRLGLVDFFAATGSAKASHIRCVHTDMTGTFGATAALATLVEEMRILKGLDGLKCLVVRVYVRAGDGDPRANLADAIEGETERLGMAHVKVELFVKEIA